MITIDEASPELKKLNEQQKKVGRELTQFLTPIERERTILAHSVLYESATDTGSIYFVTEGNLQYAVRNRLLFHFDAGDLIGVDRIFIDPVPQIRSDFAVRADVYSRSDFEKQLANQAPFRALVFEYLAIWAGIRDVVLSEHTPDVVGESLPAVRPYQPGETIITQGEKGGEVYNLLEGSAEVVVDGVSVGEIKPEEIFGAIAAFARVQRTATVTAKTECLVLTLPDEQFMELMERKPQAVMKLIEDMARTIMRLNERVVKFDKSAGDKRALR